MEENPPGMKTILAGTPSPALPARTQHYASGQRQGSTALAGLNHRVRNVLQIVGVDALLNTYSTIPEAESALS
jgi:hypothetical protein